MGQLGTVLYCPKNSHWELSSVCSAVYIRKSYKIGHR